MNARLSALLTGIFLLTALVLTGFRQIGLNVEETVEPARMVRADDGTHATFRLRPPGGVLTGWVPIGDTPVAPAFSRLQLQINGDWAVMGGHASLAEIASTPNRYRHDNNWDVLVSWPTGKSPATVVVRYPVFPRLLPVLVCLGLAALAGTPLWLRPLRALARYGTRFAWQCGGVIYRRGRAAWIGAGVAVGFDGNSDTAVSRHLDWSAMAALVAILVIAAALPRGFDLTDEGYALLQLMRPIPAPHGPYGYILGAPLRAFGANALAMRWIDLIVHVASGLILGLATLRWLAANGSVTRGHRTQALALSVIGSLLAYAGKSNTLSYNDIVSLGINVAISGTLFLLAARRRRDITASAALMALGVVLTGTAKPPTALGLTILLSGALAFMGRRDQIRAVPVLGGLAITAALVVAAALATIPNPLDWLRLVAVSASAASSEGGYT
ncbi:MAG: hypothetical protein HQL86_05490 [Magnetococcales bacterium]|nr:hypothetical protein [Magnetococcales bacterium]